TSACWCQQEWRIRPSCGGGRKGIGWRSIGDVATHCVRCSSFRGNTLILNYIIGQVRSAQRGPAKGVGAALAGENAELPANVAVLPQRGMRRSEETRRAKPQPSTLQPGSVIENTSYLN